MYIVLPAIAFAALMLAFAGRGCGVRQSFVYAAAAYTLCLVAATELLSVWNLLHLPALVGVWAGVSIIAGGYFAFYGDRKVAAGALAGAGARFREAPIILSATGVILGVILLVALAAPSSNGDAMQYHLPRVMMWLQQGSIAHYPAAYLPQLYYPPLAGWDILHLQILSGGDRFANTVQWFSLAGCGIAASLLAREMKQTFGVQVLAAVVAVTLPIGLVQGSSAQNDLVAAFWLLAFALLAIRYLHGPGAGRLLFCGLALGFALLSKGTTYAVAPPLAAMLLLYGIIRLRRRKETGYRPYGRLAGAAAVILAVALLLNGGHYARNQELFGHPLATPGYEPRNEQINLSVVWSNLVRNSALHWGVPDDRLNAFTLQAVVRIFGETIDSIPGTTFGEPLRQVGILFKKTDARAGNFLHFWFLVAALAGVLLFRKRLQPGALTVCLGLAVILGALAFSGILKWETGNSYRVVPLFMLGAPIVAVFVARLASAPSPLLPRVSPWQNRRLRVLKTASGRTSIVAGLFLAASVPWVFYNDARPVAAGIYAPFAAAAAPAVFAADREESYFTWRRPLVRSYVEAVDYIASHNPEAVGLYVGTGYDYPLWPMFEERLGHTPRLEYVGVENVSAGLGDASPPFIFSRKGSLETLGGERYRAVRVLPGVTILARADVAGAGELPERTVGDLLDEMIAQGERIISSDWDVYVSDDQLLYRKNPCLRSDYDSWIFLHIVPVSANDLPDSRRRYGYENRDFLGHGFIWQSGETCYALAWLPEYDIDRVVTGQYAPGEGGRIWEGEWRPAP